MQVTQTHVRTTGLASAGVMPTHPVDVLLVLTDADHVLLALREGTGYAAIWTGLRRNDLYAATMRR